MYSLCAGPRNRIGDHSSRPRSNALSVSVSERISKEKKTMATNEHTSAIKQTATLKGDTQMTTTEQTAVNRSTTNGHAPATMQTPKSKRIVSASQRRAEIMIATLFLVSAVTSFLGIFFLNPILNASDYLALVFLNQGAVELGSLLWSINNIGIVFIAVFAFRLLRNHDEALAVGYLATRIIEGTIMMVGIAATLLLIPLSQEFLKAGSPTARGFCLLATSSSTRDSLD